MGKYHNYCGAQRCDGSVLSRHGSIISAVSLMHRRRRRPSRCVIAIVEEIPTRNTVALLGTDDVTTKMIPMMVC